MSAKHIHVGEAHALPLSALLSQALVAFVIEFDNEFEHQTPHRTTNHGSTAGAGRVPWLVSMAMWISFMRFIPDDGITVRELQGLARLTNKELKTWITRMSQWWGYISNKKNAAGDPFTWVLQPTPGGQKALQVWRPLTGIIEKRWQERFGSRTVDDLRQSLQSLVKQLNPELPDYLPILGYEMLSTGPDPEQRAGTKSTPVPVAKYTLPILLSKVLLAFAIEYEHESDLSLAISANVLRVASEEGVRVRDLPRLSGVSKEAIVMAVKRMAKAGLVSVQPESKDSRIKAVILTAKGQHAREIYDRLVEKLEKRWQATFGDVVVDLRRSLERLVSESPAGQSLLFDGLKPYSDNWRASISPPETLPHYPMVLHRGGFPDGS